MGMARNPGACAVVGRQWPDPGELDATSTQPLSGMPIPRFLGRSGIKRRQESGRLPDLAKLRAGRGCLTVAG